jgi:hypothetical protein
MATRTMNQYAMLKSTRVKSFGLGLVFHYKMLFNYGAITTV